MGPDKQYTYPKTSNPTHQLNPGFQSNLPIQSALQASIPTYIPQSIKLATHPPYQSTLPIQPTIPIH